MELTNEFTSIRLADKASGREANNPSPLDTALRSLIKSIDDTPIKDFYEAGDDEDTPELVLELRIEKVARKYGVDPEQLKQAYQNTPDWKMFVDDSRSWFEYHYPDHPVNF